MIGAGTIAGSYRDGLRATPGFDVVAVASRNGTGACALADGDPTLRVDTVAGVLADPAINYVLNLTPAAEHGAVTRACLEAGKHVYSEKPLASDLPEADDLIALAARRGLLLACAPATFLWPPLATARRLIDEGRLGRIVGAMTSLVYPGPELFHPRPAHLYAAAAGPLRDMGVYQVRALIAMLGPVQDVCAMASKGRADRQVLVGPAAGQSFPVLASTHVNALLRHASGAISSLVVSFEGLAARPPAIDVFGRDGALTIEQYHSPEAVLRFADAPGKIRAFPPDPPTWSAASWTLGVTSAWSCFHAGKPVPTSATLARDTLEVLSAIDLAL
ncbi:MAG: Gfo/Idh/MocA family protein [Sphingomonas sp.]|uniref:Gfo/Idh/MocA family protein n=1 Tax=Sphingomonas sp. TaxID=28214 RepID=UPI003F3D6C7F